MRRLSNWRRALHDCAGMDYRLFLLMHTPLGLKLSAPDIDRLFAPELDVRDRQTVATAMVSPLARRYLEAHPDWDSKSQALWLQSRERGVRWSMVGDDDYPVEWLSLSQFPLLFSYQGEPVWRDRPAIAIVGSRTPSTETLRWMQKELPRFFRQVKPIVVSGGARGVDQWAHRLALDCEVPTVCVLPTGILNPYPPGREDLWGRVLASGGALLSTCSLFDPLRKGFFQVRNRWICGLSPICLVVEANRRSGSLLTAKLAEEEQRTVCTLPVFPTAAQGLGNLDLLQDGASLIRDSHDLMSLWSLKTARLR